MMEDRNNITLLQLMIELKLTDEQYYRVAQTMYIHTQKHEYCSEFILWLVHTNRLDSESKKKLSQINFHPIIDKILKGH